MEIVVCVKPVPDAETRLRARPDGKALDLEGVKFVLAGYDESAVEQALLLKEATPGSKVHVVSLGPGPRTEEVLRAALALGCDDAVCVESGAEPPDDPVVTARGLAEAVRPLHPDLVLFGKQAGDDEEGIVPAATAAVLGLPFFGFVVDLRWDAASGRLRFRRSVERGLETWEAPPPSAIALQQAWNDPRTAKLPAILKSRKAPIAKVSLGSGDGPAARGSSERFSLPPPRTGAKMIEGATPEETARTLVRILREEAKVFP